MLNPIGKVILLTVAFVISSLSLYAQRSPLTRAQWIVAPNRERCPVFEKQFIIKKAVKAALLSITSLGLYEATLNDRKIGDAYFTPGWTNYYKRLQYQQYVITKRVKPGLNKLTVVLSGGWYSGLFGEEMKFGQYGHGTALLCSLSIICADGTKQRINSDSSWRYGSGPLLYTDFYNGEIRDTRMTTRCSYPVEILEHTKTNLTGSGMPRVNIQETFKPTRTWKNGNGETVIDFGQNLAGFVRLLTKGRTGDTLKISHAELLDRDNGLYTGNLRDAKATDIYVLNGKEQILEPHFTYHGFRYIKIKGCGYQNCIAVAVHSQLKNAGTFSCSDRMLNQLWHNIQWSMNSNFVGIPTDCPQRSERFGWTGDAQVFCSTADYNKDVLNFYTNWLNSLKDEQGANGAVPVIVPDLEQPMDTIKQGCAGWGDAATIIPWTLYQMYGYRSILKIQYASMKAWVNYISDQSKNDLWTAAGFGDWYAMGDKTSLPFIDQCFYYHSTQLLVHAANVLGKQTDALAYARLARQIRSAFQAAYHFDTKDTRTQTAYVLALQFGLLPDSNRQRMADSLVQRIHENKDHLATGFLGTPYLLSVLTRFGYNDLAYALLLQKTCPSWLYPVTKGATTIWERWDAIKPDGRIQSCSFNHYAYGAVGQWLYEDLLGIKPASPGFKNILINPHPNKKLRWAKGSYTCQYGKIVSEWNVQGSRVKYHIIIPKHTNGVIALPGRVPEYVRPGAYHFIATIINE